MKLPYYYQGTIMDRLFKNVGIIIPKISGSSSQDVSNLVKIMGSFSDKIFIISRNSSFISENRVHIYSINHGLHSNILAKIMSRFYFEVKAAYILLKSSSCDMCIFFLGGESLLLPFLMAKLSNKKTLLVLGGDVPIKLLRLFRTVSCSLSDGIVVYSSNILNEWSLQKYLDKVYIADYRFIDFGRFMVSKHLSERENLCGYIGRFERNKGILNLLEAIKIISEQGQPINFLIIGDGGLYTACKEFIDKWDLDARVRMKCWVHYNTMAEFLNELKLLIVPSYSEGLPKVVLEAMACGTPVLATSVGGIPDFVKEGKTGFIMEDNSPEIIAKNLIRVLNRPDLDGIVNNARKLIEKEFSYDATVDRFKEILKDGKH